MWYGIIGIGGRDIILVIQTLMTIDDTLPFK